MLSKRYTYTSDQLKERYLENAIDHQNYMASLEELKNAELN